MKRLYFRNHKEWEKVKAVVETADEIEGRVYTLKANEASGLYEFDFDNDYFSNVYFSGGIGTRTDKVRPGALSFCLEKRFNEKVNQDLTYFVARNGEKLGRVENYTLRDDANLSYRNDKSKKISIFVPEHYTGEAPYDLLYFFDAQNLFSNSGDYTEKGDPYGSWQMDIILDELYRQFGRKIIVVGIDNADEYRTQELFMNPSDFGTLTPLARSITEEDFSVGYLDCLCTFMINTLHNFVKENYNITDNIGIGGSSMGGIAALYCGIRELGFFKYILAYSPAFGLYSKSSYDDYYSKLGFRDKSEILPKIHIYCGEGDDLERKLMQSARGMKWHLMKNGYNGSNIRVTIDQNKTHNEAAWRLILPESFTFVFDLDK